MQSEISVIGLFAKSRSGERMAQMPTLFGDVNGLKENVPCHRFRQVLILNTESIEQFSLTPGELRENILVDCDSLHDFPSGTELLIGALRVRLTFHCEPCKKISSTVDPRGIVHRRGYLGTILNAGEVSVGDIVVNRGTLFEEIPYQPAERVKWFLDRHPGAIAARELVSAIALRKSYCRVIPHYLTKLGRQYQNRVVFTSKTRRQR